LGCVSVRVANEVVWDAVKDVRVTVKHVRIPVKHVRIAEVVRTNRIDKDVLETWKFFGEMNDATVLVVIVDEGRPLMRFGFEDQPRDRVCFCGSIG
jgi:hypothetical protein